MKITFDNDCKKFVSKALGTLRGRNCHFCGVPLNQENWAGAYKTEDKLIFLCGSLPCLLGLVDLEKKSKQ